ncbi:uncharacterized protein LOC119222212 isoform X2 [Pungitius pungitius]|uniref:uncharacterized protein LOC119222212 isoform X2 n=1 Tax=Pungitius pungitius TaxID=134920 RepID=UPI002E0F4908
MTACTRAWGSGKVTRPPRCRHPPPPTTNSTPASVRASQSPPTQANGARCGAVNGGRGNGTGTGPMAGGGNGVNRSPVSSVNSLATQDPTAAEYASIRKFRKEAVFMGNGEQYIWKPPEEDDIITLHPPPLRADSLQGHPSPPTAKEIADTYSIVCKAQKKKPPVESNGSKTLPRSFGGGSRGRGRGVQQGQARSQEEPGYEPVVDRSWPAESDPAYATIDAHRKREPAGASNGTAGGSATLKRKKQPALQQPPAPPARGPPGGENFYESIGDVKQGASSSSTTTIFTFNDGMEMYVTGL